MQSCAWGWRSMGERYRSGPGRLADLLVRASGAKWSSRMGKYGSGRPCARGFAVSARCGGMPARRLTIKSSPIASSWSHEAMDKRGKLSVALPPTSTCPSAMGQHGMMLPAQAQPSTFGRSCAFHLQALVVKSRESWLGRGKGGRGGWEQRRPSWVGQGWGSLSSPPQAFAVCPCGCTCLLGWWWEWGKRGGGGAGLGEEGGMRGSEVMVVGQSHRLAIGREPVVCLPPILLGLNTLGS
jgi:hypothetical protein